MKSALPRLLYDSIVGHQDMDVGYLKARSRPRVVVQFEPGPLENDEAALVGVMMSCIGLHTVIEASHVKCLSAVATLIKTYFTQDTEHQIHPSPARTSFGTKSVACHPKRC